MTQSVVRMYRRPLLTLVGAILAAATCKGGTDPTCVVQSVSVSPNPVTITVSQTTTLTATVNATNCSPAPTVTWSSGSAAVGLVPGGTTAQITGVSVTASPVAVTASAGVQSGASQVSVTPVPSISLSGTNLSYSAPEGGANPASQFITITNGGGGTLSGLSTGTITYGAGATGWLQAPNLSGTTAPATLTAQPVTGALSAGIYTATIPVQSGVASNSPQNLTVTFTVTAASAQTVVAFVGNNQTGLVGFALNVRPGVRLTDAGNAPVPNVSVTFAVASGGGSVTGATVNTNADGVAQVGNWILGGSAGPNTLTATVSGAGIAGNPVSFTATGAVAAFNIAVQNVGPTLAPAVLAAFTSAVAKWQQIIYQDIPDIVNFSTSTGDCGANSPALTNVTVDDVLIFARVDSIDGPFGILGSAGPCFIRIAGRLTILGQMTFDSADVASLNASGSLNSVILHEMGHVLGFGTLWTQAQFDCLQDASNPPGNIRDTYFSCPRAVAMFDSIGGTNYTGGNKVPVENCGPASPPGCGAGNVNGHWREPTFEEELMTPFLTPGVSNPLSRLSAAAMEDLGYGVNYAGSDAYVKIFTLRAGAPQNLLSLGDDLYRGPIRVVDRSGRVVEVIEPR